MATSIEAQGLSVDEAIQIALNQLGVSRDKVEIEILHHPRRGFLGIGARRAKVRATLRESVMLDGEEFDMSGGTALDDKPRRRRRRGGRGRGRDGEGTDAVAAPAPRPSPSSGRDSGREGGRGEGRRNDGDGGRGEGPRGEGGRGREDRRDDRRGGGRGRADQRGERQSGSEGQPRSGAIEGRDGGSRGEGRDQRGSRDRGQDRGQDRTGEPRPQEQRAQDQRPQDQRSQDQRGGRPLQPREPGERRDRDRGRNRRSDGFAAGPTDEATTVETEARETAPARESESESRAPQQTVIPRRPAPSDEPPLDAEALEAIRVRAEELVKQLLSKMGFAAEVSTCVDEAAGEAVVSVRAENEGLLIGRRGQTLDSLEHIINRMVLRGDAGGDGRVLLDIGDYRRRRRESLEELAGRLKNRAVGERRTVQVSPMSPRDRRFFAQAFADDDTVEVRALGAGFYRRVIVAPAGMGAAAVAAAEAAGGVDEDGTDGALAEAES